MLSTTGVYCINGRVAQAKGSYVFKITLEHFRLDYTIRKYQYETTGFPNAAAGLNSAEA